VKQEIIRKKGIKILKIVLVVFLLTIICRRSSSSEDVWNRDLSTSIHFDPRVDAWYAVEDWEVDMCRKWGGTKEAQSGATSSTVIALSQTTLSLQGTKQAYTAEDSEEEEEVNKILYTVSWYLEPLADMNCKVVLKNDDGTKTKEISDTEASYSTPSAGYIAEYYEEGYTKVRMEYGSDSLEVKLVDIVE